MCGGTQPCYKLFVRVLDRVYPRVCGGTYSRLRIRVNCHTIRVYPRVCGGTDVCCRSYSPKCVTNGLSPRVRGHLPMAAGSHVSPYPWVYPRVCGGTSVRRHGHAVERKRPVYPRVCGGTLYRPAYALVTLLRGLSPRVRGHHSSMTLNNKLASGRVYPRVCGGTCSPCPLGLD